MQLWFLFYFCLFVWQMLLVFISITRSERSEQVVCTLRFFHSEKMFAHVPNCVSAIRSYTLWSSQPLLCFDFSQAELWGRLRLLWCIFHSECKGLHCIRGAKEKLSLQSHSENSIVYACSWFRFAESSSGKWSDDKMILLRIYYSAFMLLKSPFIKKKKKSILLLRYN